MSLLGSFIVPHPPLIIPEVGKGQEKKIQETTNAYKSIAKKIKKLKPDTIIICSPHSVNYYDYFHISPGEKASGNFNQFNANIQLNVTYDYELVKTIEQYSTMNHIPAGVKGERDQHLDHGTLIPLYFINKEYQEYDMVRISLSGLSLKKHFEFGQMIREAMETFDKKYVFIASGDLSHKLKEEGPYGYIKEGPIFDEYVIEAIRNNQLESLLNLDDTLVEKAAECGLRSFVIMAGVIQKEAFKSELISYECPFGVGYSVASFLP